MNKKAYFFIIDAILALVVLAIGVSLVLTLSYREPVKTQTEFLSADLMNPLDTRIRGGISGEKICGSGGVYEETGVITHPDNTVLTQLTEFYYREIMLGEGPPDPIDEYAKQCVQDTLPLVNIEQYNFEIVINNQTIYQNATVGRQNSSVKVIIPSREIVFGFYNDTFYGPYMAEVWVWQ